MATMINAVQKTSKSEGLKTELRKIFFLLNLKKKKKNDETSPNRGCDE